MSVRANSAFRNRFVRSSQEGADLGLVAIVFLLPLNIYIIYDIFIPITKEHIANIEQIVYGADFAIARERGPAALSAFRIPAIRSTTDVCSASSRRRIVHGQIEGP
jgi:hypothetical protein